MKFGVLYSIACMEQLFVTSITCKNALTQTSVDFEQNAIKAAINWQWRDRLRSCVRAGGGHLNQMVWNYYSLVLCGSSEHFVKPSL